MAFNVTKIQTGLYGIVGWRQSLNPDYPTIDADNLASRSGEFVTNNPHCKIEFLSDSQDYIETDDAQFNTVLKQMQEDSIANVCHRIFNKADYIDRQVLYTYAQNKIETETIPAGFICFKIRVDPKKNVAFEIKRILLDFEGAGDINIQLYNTSQSAPLFEQIVTIASTNQVVNLAWKVDNSGDTYKGEYYLGYRNNTAGIGTVRPFKRDYENSDIKSNITHLDIQNFQFVGHAVDTLPDLEDEEAIDEAVGLNPDITVYDDFTDLIIRNETLLSHAINLDLQIKCFEVYMASLRSNVNQRIGNLNMATMIQLVEGVNNTETSLKITGLRPELSRAINQIKEEINKLQDGYFSGRISVGTLE